MVYKAFLILINVENSCENRDTFFLVLLTPYIWIVLYI